MKSAKATSPSGCIRLTLPEAVTVSVAWLYVTVSASRDLVFLAQIDMPLGDDQPLILVVLHLVGRDEHRGDGGGLARFLGRGGGRERCEESGQAADDRYRLGAPHPGHPSSRCSSRVAPNSQVTPVGVQAASAIGMVPDSPRAKTTSERK